MTLKRRTTAGKRRTFVAGLLGGVLVAMVMVVLGASGDARVPSLLREHDALAAFGGPLRSVADVVEKTLPSVVNIASTRRVPMGRFSMRGNPLLRDFFRQFGPRRRPPHMEQARGSGVIIRADGVVVTNNHVVAHADKIKVVLSDKREYEATVVGTDPKSDVAVLKLKGAHNLTPIKLGNSDRLRLGDLVVAIGNPFGVGQTVTMGIVSAKGRANMGIAAYEDFIQTDAAINPGNSGGALVNMSGELVGINTAILSRTGGFQGIGFAIPSNMMRPIAHALLTRGKVVRSWLGVVIQPVNPELAKAMNLPTARGVLISDVDPRGPARGAGLRRGDLVVKVAGRRVDSPGKLRNIVASAGVSHRVAIELYRNGKRRTVKVKLAEMPADLGGQPGAGVKEHDAAGGLWVAPITRESRHKYRLPPRMRQGVVIEKVKPGSVGAAAGLRPGDVVLEVNRVSVRSPRQFRVLFQGARDKVLLLVYRRGSTVYLLLQK